MFNVIDQLHQFITLVVDDGELQEGPEPKRIKKSDSEMKKENMTKLTKMCRDLQKRKVLAVGLKETERMLTDD